MAVLEELIDYISSRGNVWYATHAQIAEYVLKTANGAGNSG
jgi:hypothetical protein